MFTSGQSSEETKGDTKTSGAETHLHLSPQRMTQNLSQETNAKWEWHGMAVKE